VSGESAFAQAVQLVAGGHTARLVAAAVEPKSDIGDRILAALFAQSPSQAHASRTDLAAALVVETERGARERGGRVLARVRQVLEWRTDGGSAGIRDAGVLASLEPPGFRAELLEARPDGLAHDILARSAWSACPRRVCAPALGESDALGAVALAVGVGRIAAGRVDEVLVLGLARGRAYAIVLER
jgi:hypothetical protein